MFRLSVFCFVLMGSALLAGALPPSMSLALLREDGPVEALSAMSYLFTAMWLLWQGRDSLARYWPSALVLVHLAVREAGMRSALLGGSGVSLSYYLNTGVPLMLRLGAALWMTLTLRALFLIARQLPKGLRALRRGEDSASWLVGALMLGLIGQLCDRWAKLFGRVPPALDPYLLGVEEVFELGMGLGIVVAALLWLPANCKPSLGRRRIPSSRCC